jgi:phenylalanyl-tRNA synthetase alpha chain
MKEFREYEIETLSTLWMLKGKASVDELVGKSGLSYAAVMRAVLNLRDKELLQINEEKQTFLNLNDEGRFHAGMGLPERRLIIALEKLGGKANCLKVYQTARLEEKFVPIALGWAQRKKWTTLDSKAGILEVVGKPAEESDEKLLKYLNGRDKTLLEELDAYYRQAVQGLKNRRLLEVEEKTRRVVELTDTGVSLLRKGIDATTEVTQLTPELIISGKWRTTEFQHYSVNAPVANTWIGKKHPYLQFLEEVRKKLVALGFREMTGTAVETSFFNFDALYTPQDHPARDLDGIYFVKSPTEGDVDKYRKTVEKVRKTHENGWKTGSTGWQYKYSQKKAKRLILRGHGTCLSARTLLSKNLQVPGRYFSIVRCYRPEVLDRIHLTEFNQVEGIIIDKDLTLRDLLGVLRKFAIEIAGADKVRFRPDYFPFTEPSVELSAYKKGYGWIEFGGSGIFRPEVTLPLGVKEPVIAWGLGIDRLFMMQAGIDDIRYIFSQDLDWIRKKELV